MIVTLTINPTIDRVISVDRLAFEDRAYINSTRESAGGRGINASCVIHSFGGKTLALLISGGDAGKRLQEHLECDGLAFQVVPIENEIRTNLTITDKHGLTVNLNEAGPTLSKAEVARVEKAVEGTLDRATWLMVCGSIPPGVPPSFYGRLIAAARKKKVKTLLHADGEALRQGIEERPTVVTPNQQEAERLLGRTLLTRTHYLEAAERIRTMGPESVVLSLGSRGAVGRFAKGSSKRCRRGWMRCVPSARAMRCRRRMPGRWGVRIMAWKRCAGAWRRGRRRRGCPVDFASLEQTQEMYKQVELRRSE